MVSIMFFLCLKKVWKMLKLRTFEWVTYRLEIRAVFRFIPVKSNTHTPL